MPSKTEAKQDKIVPKSSRPEFAQILGEHLRAGYQCMWVPTSEEARLEAEIARVAQSMSAGSVITWSLDEGFSAPDKARNETKYQAPAEALRAIAGANSPFTGNQIFVFRDFDDFQEDPMIRRLLRSLCEQNKLVNKRYKRPIIISTPRRRINEKLRSCCTVVEFDLPGESKLRGVLEFVRASIESSDPTKAQISEELSDKIVQCLRGLTSTEAENALSRCLVRHGGFCEDMLGTIKDEKASIVKKSEVLTYIPEENQASRDQIGGFGELLSWVDRRSHAYSKEANELRIDYPKGVVLIGVPGTGKSYVAAAVARLLGLPGYIMDIGSIFGALVGESEQRMRDAIRQIEAQQGCVLLLDEADKAFGGATTGQGDSGVTKRVFGQLLNWLSSKQDRTFVIMTMNRTRGIDPEFLRAGRFDAVFYTDLPFDYERRDILNIHLKKRSVNPDELGFSQAEWNELIAATQDFVGAEIEQIVREARYISFERRRSGTPTFEEFMEAKESVIPIAELEKEKVQEIRDWCKTRAKNVSKPPATKRQPRTRSVSVDN